MEDLDFDKLENELKEEHGKIFLIFQLNNSLKDVISQTKKIICGRFEHFSKRKTLGLSLGLALKCFKTV
jgi:hypothetical protein